MRKELEIFLTSTNDGVIAIDANCIITLYNKQAELLIGIPKEVALGKNVKDVVMNTRLPYVLETGEHELEWHQQLRDFEIITSRIPIKDSTGKTIGAMAVFRNVTDTYNLDKQLSSLNGYKSLLQAVFAAVQDAISVVDENGNHIMVNPAYTRITGITADEIYGKPAGYDIEEGESIHLKILSTKRPVGNTKMVIKPSGKMVIARGAPMLVGDQVKGSVVILHDISEIKQLTEKLLEAQKRIRELSARYTLEDIVGDSKIIQQAKQQLIKASNVPASVILKGESGTGKELFAHAIHNESSRKNEQFIRVNCAAIPETLLESELFGYDEGAFTGAKKGGKKGLFEEANNGTIFLDEISEVSNSTQVKLLRVLQEKEITRVGGVTPIHVNVRVISATNVNLKERVDSGSFRDDLYYRLNVFPIDIPPLRDRIEDVDALVKRFIEKLDTEYGRNVTAISEEAIKELKQYSWPGNVRELENVIGRAMINMNINEKTIKKEHLPILNYSDKTDAVSPVEKPDLDEISKLSEVTDEFEKKYISQVYNLCEKNKTTTAKRLGISIRNLYYKMERHNIN
ncbi:MAG TPA: sigma-54-dependent Fis family transcriptional regulator [Clostridiales bacterium]|nr:sigma-54-dependent Fis family transcriptional regulator [Clostridiales bacterium]